MPCRIEFEFRKGSYTENDILDTLCAFSELISSDFDEDLAHNWMAGQASSNILPLLCGFCVFKDIKNSNIVNRIQTALGNNQKELSVLARLLTFYNRPATRRIFLLDGLYLYSVDAFLTTARKIDIVPKII